MAVKVHIPTPLRAYVQGNDEVVIDSNMNTVDELFNELSTRFPELQAHLYDQNKQLRKYINIYVNDEDIRFSDHEKTALKSGDEVSIVPSIAGG